MTQTKFDLLLEKISAHIKLSDEDKAFLLSRIQYKKIKRKQIYLQEGDVSRVITFVLSGCLKLYSIDRNGFEHILQFAPPGWWVGDMKSFINQEPALLNIDAIYDSELAIIAKPELDDIYSRIPAFERFFRILAENAIAAYQQRLINNLSLPAKDRYSTFCELYPSLIMQLPQKMIASYIGVTPEFLSKMLKQQA